MKVRIIWVMVFAAVALLVVFGADRRQTTTVSLRNEADVTLADVKIALAGKEIWNGQIEPGEKQYARGRPDRDGAVRISFRARNAGPLSADFGRAATSAGDEYDFVVTEDLEIRAAPPP